MNLQALYVCRKSENVFVSAGPQHLHKHSITALYTKATSCTELLMYFHLRASVTDSSQISEEKRSGRTSNSTLSSCLSAGDAGNFCSVSLLSLQCFLPVTSTVGVFVGLLGAVYIHTSISLSISLPQSSQIPKIRSLRVRPLSILKELII